MSDVVLVALIAGGFNILAVVIGRLMSRLEHKKTENYLITLINGKADKHSQTEPKTGAPPPSPEKT